MAAPWNVCVHVIMSSLHLQTSSSPWSWSRSWQLWSQWWEGGTCWGYTWVCLTLWWTQSRETTTPPPRGRRGWFRGGCQPHSSVPPGAPWCKLCVKLAWILLQKRSQRNTVSVLWTSYSIFCREYKRKQESGCKYSEVCVTWSQIPKKKNIQLSATISTLSCIAANLQATASLVVII